MRIIGQRGALFNGKPVDYVVDSNLEIWLNARGLAAVHGLDASHVHEFVCGCLVMIPAVKEARGRCEDARSKLTGIIQAFIDHADQVGDAGEGGSNHAIFYRRAFFDLATRAAFGESSASIDRDLLDAKSLDRLAGVKEFLGDLIRDVSRQGLGHREAYHVINNRWTHAFVKAGIDDT